MDWMFGTLETPEEHEDLAEARKAAEAQRGASPAKAKGGSAQAGGRQLSQRAAAAMVAAS
jgi:hypothetical protein